MSLNIRQILIALTLISIIYECQCKREQTKRRLSRVFENLIERNSKHYEKEIDNDIGRALNVDCVRNFFHLPQNSKMFITEIEEMIFMIAAAMQCSDEDKVFETQFNQYIRESLKQRFNCVRWHLSQLEPTSQLVENFVISEDELEECEQEFPIDELVELQKNIEIMLGPLNVYTCGAVSENGANDMLKFLGKGTVIKYGDVSDELKKSEKEKLKNYFKDISTTTINCILKRYEDNPTAHSINETLNFYYKVDIESTNRYKKDPDGYYKKLIRVEEAIDKDCVKEKLNLPDIGDKTLLVVEARLLIASAKSKCIKVSPLEFSDLFVDYAVDEDYRSDRFFGCAKYKLHNLEPTSKLADLSTIDKSTFEESPEDDCEYISTSLHPFRQTEFGYEQLVGRLNETTCGVLTKDIVKVITYKTALLGGEKDKDLKISETKDLFKYATDKLHKLSDCVIERIK